MGAISELHYVTASHDEQLRRISSRSPTDPHTSFEISNDERRGGSERSFKNRPLPN